MRVFSLVIVAKFGIPHLYENRYIAQKKFEFCQAQAIPNSQFPITNYQLPITNYQFPIPNSQFPIPNSQFPIPNSQF
ncbi:hypothetical protein QUB38_23195, partial [Microcoleus sp. Aus8_D3]